MYHVRDLAPVSKENKRCTSQHTHIAIVELVHRLYGKTCIFLFFVRYHERLKHVHVYVVLDRELGLGINNIAQCLPISRDSDVTSFLTAGPLRMIIWLIKIEGHRPPDNNEVSRALPFYELHSLISLKRRPFPCRPVIHVCFWPSFGHPNPKKITLQGTKIIL